MNYDIEARQKEKMHTTDRLIVLRPMEGKDPKDAQGNVDKRLFSGENNLHAVYDVNKGWWSVRYDKGAIPGGLDRNWTDLTNTVDTVRQYFAARNVEVVEVRD